MSWNYAQLLLDEAAILGSHANTVLISESISTPTDSVSRTKGFNRAISESITGPSDGDSPLTIQQIGSVALSATTATNPGTITTPAGAANGDLLIFFVGWYDDVSTSGVTITPPTGATLVSGSRIDHVSGGDNYITSAIYVLQLTGAPAATYSFSISSHPYGVGVSCVCLRNVDSVTPVDVSSVNDGHTNKPTATGVTIGGSTGEWLFLFCLGDSNSLINTNFPTFAYLDTTNSGSNDARYASFHTAHALGDIQNIALGATGNYQATLSAADDWTATLVAFKPTIIPGVSRIVTTGGGTAYTRTITESVTGPSDSVARTFTGSRTVSEAISAFTDSVVRVITTTRSIAESITGPSDSVAGVRGAVRALTESITGPSDAVSRAATFGRAISESVTGPSDAVARVVTFFRSLAESVTGPSDAVSRSTGSVRAITESVTGPTDSLVRSAAYQRAVAEAATGPSDSVARVATYLRIQTESIATPSDSVSRALSANRSITESIAGPTDAVSRALAYSRALSESIGAPNDGVQRLAAYFRAISESVATPTDSVSQSTTHGGNFTRSIPESITGPSDSVARSYTGTRSISESLSTPSDSVQRLVVYARSIGDSIPTPIDFVEQQTSGAAYVREITESIGAGGGGGGSGFIWLMGW